MGGDYFVVCWTCKSAEWWNESELSTYIHGHVGHKYTILTRDVYEDEDEFRLWFLNFMGWPEEEGEEVTGI